MKRLFFLLILTLVVFSCGDSEEDDPQPVKTNLDTFKENFTGYFDLQSIVVEKNSEIATYSGGCDESSFPAWAAANIGDIDYDVATSSVQVIVNCPPVVTDRFQYTVTEQDNKIFIDISDGRLFELISKPEEFASGKTIKLKCVEPLLQGATGSVWTYKIR